MINRREPWKWPLAIGLALVLTGGLFWFLPESWLEVLPNSGPGSENDLQARSTPWIFLLPPQEIAQAIDLSEESPPLRTRETVPAEDPRWWSEGWRVQTKIAVFRDLAPTAADSARTLLIELGVGLDFLQQARPDSLLAARLALMRLEDDMRFDDLKPYLSAMTRARAYADILSRAADMYDDFLQSKIMVPD